MLEDGQYDGPKHVACIDETIQICCGWLYAFVSFNLLCSSHVCADACLHVNTICFAKNHEVRVLMPI
jgi:hypothetical protein